MSPSTITVGEITGLNHETVNHPVERGVVLASHSYQELEVHGRDRALCVVEAQRDVAKASSHLKDDQVSGWERSEGEAAVLAVVVAEV